MGGAVITQHAASIKRAEIVFIFIFCKERLVEKSKIGLIVAVVIVIGAVAYLSFKKSPEVAVEPSADGQTAAAPGQASAPVSQAVQSSEVKKGDVLAFTPGQASGTPNKPQGSWFSLELMKGFATYIGLQPGPDGGIFIIS